MGFLPAADAAYLNEKGVVHEEVQEGGRKAVILLAYPLPASRFDCARADILILLPPGYPDVSPDMFYLVPWVRLAGANRFPRCADVPFTFRGQQWQRWSRHNTEWRSGVDGIWTMVKRIETALAAAA
jgi:Prokaryotic E2 family E